MQKYSTENSSCGELISTASFKNVCPATSEKKELVKRAFWLIDPTPCDHKDVRFCLDRLPIQRPRMTAELAKRAT